MSSDIIQTDVNLTNYLYAEDMMNNNFVFIKIIPCKTRNTCSYTNI